MRRSNSCLIGAADVQWCTDRNIKNVCNMNKNQQFAEPPVADDAQLTHAAVHEAYARDPSAHPGLLAEMNRLARQEAELANPAPEQHVPVQELTSRELGVVALEKGRVETPADTARQGEKTVGEALRETVEQIRGIDRYADDYCGLPINLRLKVKDLIALGTYSSQELNDFTAEVLELMPTDGLKYLRSWLYKAPTDILKGAYHPQQHKPGELGPVDRVFEYTFKAPDTDMRMLGKLVEIHGLKNVLSLKCAVGAHEFDPNVQRIINREDFGLDAMSMDLASIGSEKKVRLEQEEPAYFYDWAEQYLKHIVELPRELRADLLFASRGRTTLAGGGADLAKLEAMLLATKHNVGGLNEEELRALHKRAGVVNIDRYSYDQIHQMVDFVNGDEALLKHLQAGDVTVVFTDAKGDYNGAFNTVGEQYDTTSGRTLFFEVSRKTDFSRYRAMLTRFGIKASTLVFAAHGSPVYGRDYGGKMIGFNVAAQSSRWQDLSIADAEWLSSILDDIMQDSRGIDDDEQALGRRRIILNSCSQDKRGAWVTRKLPGGMRIAEGYESTAESLARSVADPRLDVYGLDADHGTWAAPYGIESRVAKDPAMISFTKETSIPWDYHRLVMGRDGRLHVMKMAWLPLRKGAPEVRAKSVAIRLANGERPLYDWEERGT